MYTAAMAEVAREQRRPFVDLFAPSLRLYERDERPLTINGVHLNAYGDRQLADVIDQALFGRRGAATFDGGQLEQLRQAVLDKNFIWFERYRTTDGYSIFGGRADLKFVDGQTNREVMQREMEVLERDDRQPRPAHLGRGWRQRAAQSTTATRRLSSKSSRTSPARCPAASTSSWAARKRSAR